MIASLLLLIETLFRDSLPSWAFWIHMSSLVLLAAAWGAPPVLFFWKRRSDRRRPPVRLYWRCACGRDNPPEAAVCPQCAKAGPSGAASTSARRAWAAAGKWTSLAVRWLSLLVLYAVPAVALLAMDAHRFGGGALRELLAGGALLASLAAAVLLRSALGGAVGLLTRAVSLLAAGTLAGGALLMGVLWAAAPFPPSRPMAVVRLFPNGRVSMELPGGARVEGSGKLQDGAVEFRVRSARLSWPLMQLGQTVPLSTGDRPLVEPWVVRLIEKGARRWTEDAPHKLRVSLREDTLFQQPGGPYVLRESADGGGLVLAAPDEQR